MSYRCLKDSKTKKYIIPTNEWLEPLNELITDSIATKGLLMLSKFIGAKCTTWHKCLGSNHEVVVKITRNV